MGKVYTNKYSKTVEGVTFFLGIDSDTFTLSAFDKKTGKELLNAISDMAGYSDKETLERIAHVEKQMLSDIHAITQHSPSQQSLMQKIGYSPV